MNLPFARSYWAEPGRLLAGCYPGDPDPQQAEKNLQGLLACGVRTVINLTEERETDRRDRAFVPYADVLRRLAEPLGVEVACLRHPVRDVSVPSARVMDQIVSSIDASIERGDPVYVHCWGGRGRTGIAVGVHLIRRGLATSDDFMDVIAKLRAHDPGGGGSPETRAQVAFVRQYVGDGR